MHTHNLASCLIGSHPHLPAFPVQSFHELVVGLCDRLGGKITKDTSPDEYLPRLHEQGFIVWVPNTSNVETEGPYLVLLTERGVDCFLSVEGFRIDPDEDLIPLLQKKTCRKKSRGKKK